MPWRMGCVVDGVKGRQVDYQRPGGPRRPEMTLDEKIKAIQMRGMGTYQVPQRMGCVVDGVEGRQVDWLSSQSDLLLRMSSLERIAQRELTDAKCLNVSRKIMSRCSGILSSASFWR